jgi:hypothetical protein
MRHFVLGEAHRYGERVASMIRMLFPGTCSHVHARVTTPQSIIPPPLLHLHLPWCTDVLRLELFDNMEVYGDIVVRYASEAVGAFEFYLVSAKKKTSFYSNSLGFTSAVQEPSNLFAGHFRPRLRCCAWAIGMYSVLRTPTWGRRRVCRSDDTGVHSLHWSQPRPVWVASFP